MTSASKRHSLVSEHSSDEWSGEDNTVLELLVAHRQQLESRLSRTCSRHFAARFSSEDVVQETMVRVTREMHSFRGRTEEEFWAWVHAILRSQLSSMCRYHQALKRSVLRESHVTSQSEQESSPELCPVTRMLAREFEDRLSDQMHMLTDKQRIAVTMHYLDGISMVEVGRRLSIPPSSARNLLDRGIRRLRQAMRDWV